MQNVFKKNRFYVQQWWSTKREEQISKNIECFIYLNARFTQIHTQSVGVFWIMFYEFLQSSVNGHENEGEQNETR
jgi:hypothetical protein